MPRSLAYVAAEPPGENNWWVAKLYTQTLGGEAKAIFSPEDDKGGMHGLQMAVPRWSPDGKQIAFIGGLMSDQGSTGGDVWVISSAGGEPKDVTPERPTSPAWITWADNARLFVSELAGGNSQLAELPVAGGEGRVVYSFPGTTGDGRMHLSLSTTADRSTFVFNAMSFEKPIEAYAVPSSAHDQTLSGLTQLTHVNDGIQPIWGKTESLTWTNDGFHVQGWLHYPKDL